MSTHEDFPAELVEARAKELYDEAWGAGEWEAFTSGVLREHYRNAARLSLRREVEACEPLVKALVTVRDCGAPVSAGVAKRALAAHRARYAPKPETLADVVREALAALSGNAVLSERLRAALAREVKP